MTASPILQIPNTNLGEGPVWDHRTQELWWTDITNGLLHCYLPKEDSNKTYEIGQMVGTPIPCEEEGLLLLAMHHGFAFFNRETGTLSLISDPESDLPNNRFNDGKCDPAGRLWAGTMKIGMPREPVGNLYRLDTDLKVMKQLSGIYISNGLAWTKDGSTMYYIDTVTQKVQRFKYDLSTGEIEKEADVLKFKMIWPDGMCIDENDNLWIAFYGAGKVCCYDPRTGEKLEQIKVAATCPTSCAFGGEDLETLFITSAAHDGDEFGGILFSVKPGVKGRKAHFFNPKNK